MKKKSILSFLVSITLTLCFSLVSSAQSSGSIKGSVTDEQKAKIEDLKELERLREEIKRRPDKPLVFPLEEVKLQSNGGRGLTLMHVDAKDPLLSVATCRGAITVLGAGRSGKPKEETLRGAALAGYVGKRARKGKLAPGMKSGVRVVAA